MSVRHVEATSHSRKDVPIALDRVLTIDQARTKTETESLHSKYSTYQRLKNAILSAKVSVCHAEAI